MSAVERATAKSLADNRVAGLLRFLALLVFYVVTTPLNHTESWDGYHYGMIAENFAVDEVRDPRSLLFHFMNRVLYLALNGAGLEISGFTLILLLNSVAGALCVVLFARLLHRGFQLSFSAAWVTALTLAVCYGFWRYAVEAEVYVASAFLIVATLNLIVDADQRPRASWRTIAGAGVLAGLGVLYNQPLVIPLFFAMPLLFWRRDRILWLFVYWSIGTAIFVVGVLLAFWVSQDQALGLASLNEFLSSRNQEFHPQGYSLKLLAKSIASLGQIILAVNWLFEFDAFSRIVAQALPQRMIDEEIFAAKAYGAWNYVPALLAPLLAVLAGWALWLVVRHRVGRPMRRSVAFALVWVVLFVVIVAPLGAGALEPWITFLLPVMLLYGYYIVEPLARLNRLWIAGALAAALAVFNFAGGMGMLYNPDGDYFRAKTAWLQEQASPGDTVILTELNWGFHNYLAAVVGVHPVYITAEDQARLTFEPRIEPNLMETILTEAQTQGTKVYVFDEFLQPSHRAKARRLEGYEFYKELADRYRDQVREVGTGPVGKTYQLLPSAGS